MTEHEREKFGMLVLREAADESASDQNVTPVDEEPSASTGQLERVFKMSEKRISLGINVSILVILMIFGVLLSLPLRMLLNTNYESNQTLNENCATETKRNETSTEIMVIPIDHRKLKRCPRYEYVDHLQSVFLSNYDRNCTFVRNDDDEEDDDDDDDDDSKEATEDNSASTVSEETVGEDSAENAEDSGKDRRMKSVPVAGHILVTMLVISAIAALVEVLRIRFARDKDSSKAGNAGSRKASTVELPVRGRIFPRQPMNSQRSFEMQGMHRSALRLLGSQTITVSFHQFVRDRRRLSAAHHSQLNRLSKTLPR
ncbi:uncharacterized protein LOC128886601 isoform X2 [Hylaeus anthracinus]|uniref:uncharacterized protein LOC128886601 isoform X2 n=1 Tax=Hylaeus anthracinus TaxID=313031 RepID=UPI0023B92589|nr:uncharacterized protein LOC128886601 isoform X2 [Hylaeus anthracinus]